MRLLVLSSRPPYPPVRADQMTVEHMIRFLVGKGHTVDLACFVESAAEEAALREGLGGTCRRIDVVRWPRPRAYAATAAALPSRTPLQVAYFRSRAMQRLVRERVEQERHDLVYTHLIRMSEYSRHLPVPRVLGLQISQALNLQRMVDHAGDPFRRLFYRTEQSRVRPYEAGVAADFDRVFLCGERDLQELERSRPVENAEIRPHGQDVPPLERVRAAEREPNTIVFCGVLATYTNVDAAIWLAREIFPRVEAELPDARLWLVGRQPQRSVRALARPPRVEVTGEVPDVTDWLARASVSVDPLRIGAGMQNKILQAMGCELPVVATPIANEGIGAKPDREIWLREDADSFAEAVVELLRDREAREALGRAGRAFVEANWTWEAHFEKLHRTLLEVAASGRAPLSRSAR